MFDPYKLIVVNSIASIVVFLSLGVYYFIFPKRKIPSLLIVLLISLLPLISLLRKGVYESGDLAYHIKNTIVFYQSLSNGIGLPRWSPFGSNGYGAPDFILLYLSPYYIMSIFHFLGMSFVASSKLLLALSFVASGIGAYLWLKNVFNEKAALVGAIFYLYAPYHLIDMHFRNAVGELLGFSILPFIFLLAFRLTRNLNKLDIILFSTAIGSLILSHQVLSFVTIPLVCLYFTIIWFLDKKRKIKSLVVFLMSIICGIGLSTFYWLPLLIEKKYVGWNTGGEINLLHVQDLLYTPWRWGLLFQGHTGQLSFLIGYAQIVIVIITIFIIIKKGLLRSEKIITLFFLGIFFVLSFLMTTYSAFLWEYIPLLNFFGFSYRLLIVVCLITSYLAAFCVSHIKNNFIILGIVALAIFATILNWGNRTMLPNFDDQILKEQTTTDVIGLSPVSLPIWVKGNYYYKNGRVKNHLEVIRGDTRIKNIVMSATKHEYLITTTSKSTFMENTFYFPDWKLSINNKPYSFSYASKPNPGTMKFILNPGMYDVLFEYHNPPIQRVANVINLGVLSILLLYLCIRLPKKQLQIKPWKQTKKIVEGKRK